MSLASIPTTLVILAAHLGRQNPIIEGVHVPRSSFMVE
jgi:hypothetical protein